MTITLGGIRYRRIRGACYDCPFRPPQCDEMPCKPGRIWRSAPLSNWFVAHIADPLGGRLEDHSEGRGQ